MSYLNMRTPPWKKGLRALTTFEGWGKIGLWIYENTIRPHFTHQQTVFNDVAVMAAKTPDKYLPWYDPSSSNYESALCELLESRVREGDKVVLVGGGWGVSAVKAANSVGRSGEVIVFEGGESEVNVVAETCSMNGVLDTVEIRHAIVGEGISLRSSGDGAKKVAPSQLPSCDILQLDCEGAELGILDGLVSKPREIFVESHGHHGSPPESVEQKLNHLGYNVVEKSLADIDERQYCINKQIVVLHAVRDNDES